VKRLICITAVLVLTLIGAGVVQAQNQVQIPVIIHIPQIIIMTLDATELVFDKVDFDYVLGTARLTKVGVIATKREAVTVTIEGNIPYTWYISAPEEYLFGANGDLLHISQLTWGLSRGEADGQGEGGEMRALTLERVPVQSGPPGKLEIKLDFQLTAYWENPAQTYTGDILFTVIPDES